jgi:hypothetical protein
MTDENIDRILAHEEPLVPSSGFVSAVMERVREEAAAPPPIPFPWKRALPGLVPAAAVLGWGGFALVRYGIPAMRSSTSIILPAALKAGDVGRQALWIALALAVSLASWLVSRSLVADRGLL